MTTPTTGLEQIDDGKLLHGYQTLLEASAEAHERLGRLEQEIFRRMEERGATTIPSEQFTCELQTGNSYNQEDLTVLKELLNPTDLAACWTASYQRIVTEPEKWNIRKLLPVARRYGDRVMAVVERSKSISGRKLKFEVKD